MQLAPSPAAAPARPWSLFDVTVASARYVTPSMVRVTLTAGSSHPDAAADAQHLSESIAHFADFGFDQRVKLVLPAQPGADVPRLDPSRWYQEWRALPDDTRPILRTYTVRRMRHIGTTRAEIDIDFVVHGTDGPASAWAHSLVNGPCEQTRLKLLGPDARCPTDPGGREFRQCVTDDLLLAGDETALPAIGAIADRLDPETTGTILVEVPGSDDDYRIDAPSGMRVHLLPRDGAAHGQRLVEAAMTWRPERADLAREVSEPDLAAQLEREWEQSAWDVPRGDRPIRAWVAGEASSVRSVRRHLVGPCGLDRREVAFMGYWRLGRSEN